jgi:PAS domain S-box-containing protein
MWGKTAEDAIGRGLRENGYEEWHAQMHEREIDLIAANKKTIRGTVSFPHAELGSRVYDYILTPVLNAQGKVEAVAGITRDITDIKKAEEKLQNSETRFRNMIEQAPVAMLLSKGEDVIIESVNKPMLQFMNKSAADEALGKKMLEALPELAGQPSLQTVINVQKTGIPFRGDEQPVDLMINGKLERRYFNFSYDSIKEEAESSAVLHMAIDVTEQVLARRKLEDSESRLKSMIEQTPCPTLVLMGDDLVIEQINKHMLQMIGRDEEIIGMPLIDVLPELKGQYVWDQVQNVYNKGIPFDQSEVLVPHNRTGEIKGYYYNLAYRPLIENRQIIGMIQTAVDVTEQVTARKKLEESESRFRNVINTTPVGTAILIGPEMVIGVANDVIIKYWNRDKSVIGKPLMESIPELIGQPFPDLLSGVYNTGITHDDNHALVYLNNAEGKLSPFYFKYSYTALRETDGAIYGVLIMSIDVTEEILSKLRLEESEKGFRMLSDEMPQFVWTSDAEGHLAYFNHAMHVYSGLRLSDIKEKGWIEIVHPQEREESIRLWEHSINTGEDFIFEHRFRRADGEYHWQLSRAVPQRDVNGIIQQWIGTSTDIHEQKNITEKLESLVADRTKELQRSNEDLQQFAHVASHDLKEPVRKIKTFTARLEDHIKDQLDESGKKFIDRIHVATDRMFNMIDGVLAYSKINADLQTPIFIDLNEVIKNIETDLEVALQKTGGKIYYDNLPTLEGALVLIYQLFYNLINNSIKFAKADTPPIITIISKIIVENNKSFAIITVEDNGIGFDSHHAERIFETFSRLNSKDSYEGTGLGLSLCKKIVERHEGKISAVGSLNKGASFIITLPLLQREKDI